MCARAENVKYVCVQLGLNDTKDRGDNDGDVGDLLPSVSIGNGLQATQVTAGLRHTAAIMDDSTVRSWGYNGKGQLGIGSIANVGGEPDSMGDNMITTLLGDSQPTYIQAGGWHTCAIMDGTKLKCWGKRAGVGGGGSTIVLLMSTSYSLS